MKKQKFNIPDECKTVTFEQVGNQVIATFEPEIKFKEGDFIYSKWDDESAILISNRNYKVENDYIYYHACLNSCDKISYDEYIGHLYARTDRLATESERQLLIDALAKEGKMWDAEKMAIVDLKYIPKVGDCVKRICENTFVFGQYLIGDIIGNCIVCSDEYEYPEIRKFWNCLEPDFTFTKITREELQAEFNKIGYQYDFKTHTASKIRWKPKNVETYYFVDTECEIQIKPWVNDNLDKGRFEIGNCYKTPEEAEPRRNHYLSFKD